MRSSNAVKRTLCLLLIAAMLIMNAVPAFASKKGKGAYVVTTVEKHDRLNVRLTPSINSEVIDHLKKNTVVVYKSSKKGWWKVAYNGGSGYVDSKYLTSVASLPSAKYKAVKKLPVYAKAKTSSAYLGTLKTSVKVSIVGMSKSWVKIKKGSHVGWVSAKYLRRVS